MGAQDNIDTRNFHAEAGPAGNRQHPSWRPVPLPWLTSGCLALCGGAPPLATLRIELIPAAARRLAAEQAAPQSRCLPLQQVRQQVRAGGMTSAGMLRSRRVRQAGSAPPTPRPVSSVVCMPDTGAVPHLLRLRLLLEQPGNEAAALPQPAAAAAAAATCHQRAEQPRRQALERGLMPCQGADRRHRGPGRAGQCAGHQALRQGEQLRLRLHQALERLQAV